MPVRMEQFVSHRMDFYEIWYLNIFSKIHRQNTSFYWNVTRKRSQVTRRRVRIACWIAKATDAHSEYVILIAFHVKDGRTNAPRCYVIRTVPSCWMLNLVVHVVNMSQDSLLGLAAPCLLNVPGIESRPGPTRPPIQWGTWLFARLKRPAIDVNHPPASTAEVKERVEIYLYCPLCAFMAFCSLNTFLQIVTSGF